MECTGVIIFQIWILIGVVVDRVSLIGQEKLIYKIRDWRVVKELNIYIMKEDLSKVTDTLRNFNVSGMSFDEVQGAGRMKRREIRERDGWSVRTVTPEYEGRIRVVTVVPDNSAKEIIDDLVNNMGSQNEPRGVIIVKEVSNVYEIGTKQSGDTILTHEHHVA
jgi:nitrogen regulatory protein P-II 1